MPALADAAGPALMGAVSAAVSENAALLEHFPTATPDQLGLKTGMLFCVLFPLGIVAGVRALRRLSRAAPAPRT